MDINNIRLGNLNSNEGLGQAKKSEQEINSKQFNPGSQSIPSQGAINQLATRARILNKNSKYVEKEESSSEEHEMEVATLGFITLNDEQLQGFRERLEQGILRQEHEILDSVNSFSGSDRMLRNIIGGLLLS